MADDQRPVIIIRKKKAAHAAHHGGAWKVAYADFVTAMMALFIVLWLLTQADLELKQNIAQYFRSPGVLEGGSMVSSEFNEAKNRSPKVVSKEIVLVQGSAEQERLEGQKKMIEERLSEAARTNPDFAKLSDQVIVQVTDAGLSIQVVDKGRDLLFDLASAELKAPLIELLKRLAEELGRMPNRITLGGHTDSRPFPRGSAITNWELAFARANAARRVMEAHGLWHGQINKVIGYADSELLVPGNPLADENRRLSILAQREGPVVTPPPEGQPAPVALPPDPLPR
jgi:chemotaxis protein MotB